MSTHRLTPSCQVCKPRFRNNHSLYFATGYDAVFSAILEGFEDMEKTSGCISFKSLEELPGDRKQYKAFLNITEGPMCSAKFGDPNRPAYHVTLNKDCISRKKGIIQRLVMLALGFPHTITRNDRDSFININWDNVLPGKVLPIYFFEGMMKNLTKLRC